MSGLFLKRPLHDGRPLLDARAYLRYEFVRQHVGDPDETAPVLALREHLERGVVMGDRHPPLDHRVGQPARPVVDVDDQFADLSAAGQGEGPEVSLETRVDDVSRQEATVHSTDVADRRPNPLGRDPDRDLLANRSH